LRLLTNRWKRAVEGEGGVAIFGQMVREALRLSRGKMLFEGEEIRSLPSDEYPLSSLSGRETVPACLVHLTY
jgi:hypothetical protein